MLLSFTGPNAVLVATGPGPWSNGIEVFDLEDPTNVCSQSSLLADYPLDNVESATGGLLLNKIVLICGGRINNHAEDDCFAITENATEATVKLAQPRQRAASVVINRTTLWLTGGYVGNDNAGVMTNSTEFVELNGTIPGPDLPLVVQDHCLVSLNDTNILLIGGCTGGLTKARVTFYYNIELKTWTDGPLLIIGRCLHSCALFKSHLHNHTDTVIVTGGNTEGNYGNTAEFLNLDSNVWTPGITLSHNHSFYRDIRTFQETDISTFLGLA
jgi:hypothetical protein